MGLSAGSIFEIKTLSDEVHLFEVERPVLLPQSCEQHCEAVGCVCGLTNGQCLCLETNFEWVPFNDWSASGDSEDLTPDEPHDIDLMISLEDLRGVLSELHGGGGVIDASGTPATRLSSLLMCFILSLALLFL